MCIRDSLEGGVSITYQVKGDNPSQKDMDDTVYKLQKRVEQYSTEAVSYTHLDVYKRQNIRCVRRPEEVPLQAIIHSAHPKATNGTGYWTKMCIRDRIYIMVADLQYV